MIATEARIETKIGWNVASAGPDEGDPVLLLHGFPEIWRSWHKQIQPLADAGYRVHAADLPGYGGTDPPASYALADLAEHLVHLARALAPSGIHLVGHDWGGVIGQAAAARDAAAFRSLVVAAAPHPDALPSVLTDPAQIARFWYVGLVQLPGIDKVLGARDAMLAKRIFGGPTSGLGTPESVTRALEYYRTNARPARAIRLRVGRVPQPGLVVHAARDAHVGARLMRATAGRFDDLRGYHEIDCGHFVHRWCPEAFNRVLLEFLDSVRGHAR